MKSLHTYKGISYLIKKFFFFLNLISCNEVSINMSRLKDFFLMNSLPAQRTYNFNIYVKNLSNSNTCFALLFNYCALYMLFNSA